MGNHRLPLLPAPNSPALASRPQFPFPLPRLPPSFSILNPRNTRNPNAVGTPQSYPLKTPADARDMTTPTQSVGKPICSICYEDFKPIAEDLQSITICGHVFHELCIQQWLEYCPSGKKPTCPVCKQSFARNSLLRLYFQSAGAPLADAAAHPLSQCTRAPPDAAEVDRLREHARKLEGKLSVIGSAFVGQKKRVGDLSEEVSKWKERASKEEAAKDVIRRKKDRLDTLLREKQEELSVISVECTRLRERSLALAKELAALKLSMDVNLEEEEVMKLASVGSGGQLADAIDVLKKSLVLRNKSYKELMAQCNLLGRSENRALKKLEKAEGKIRKLKARLQELEKVLEEKENGILRNLKSLKKETTKVVLGPDTLYTNTCLQEVEHGDYLTASRLNGYSLSGTSPVDAKEKERKFRMEPDLVRKENTGNDVPMSNVCFPFDKNADDFHSTLVKTSAGVLERNHPVTFCEDLAAQWSDGLNRVSSPTCERASDHHVGTGERCLKLSGAISGVKKTAVELSNSKDLVSTPTVVCIDEDFECDTLLPNNNETLADDVNTFSGALSFANGSLGAKDDKRLPTKCCGWGQSTVSPTMLTSTSAGSLIAVGADGRGGKIKVLRTNQNSYKSEGLPPKRLKSETKQVPNSKGCLQIEHFFGSKGNN